MVFIVGLGNPGPEYADTRHNAGWLMLDVVATALGAPAFTYQKKFQAEIAKVGEVVLIKPHTFMNASGQAVRAVIDYYQKPSDSSGLATLVVIHDDLDLELGHYKIQLGTGPKIHNGLLSLYQHLGTQQFWHVRLGVDDRKGDRSIPGSSYVLQSFSTEQKATLLNLADEVIAHVRRSLHW